MATKALAAPVSIGAQAWRFTWVALSNGDDGAPVNTADLADMTFSIPSSAVFGAGGTILCEGSVDGVNWFTLKDPSSTPISLTAAGHRAVLEHCPFTRCRVSAGDGTTSVPAILMARRVGR
jgi:hypothetical protein